MQQNKYKQQDAIQARRKAVARKAEITDASKIIYGLEEKYIQGINRLNPDASIVSSKAVNEKYLEQATLKKKGDTTLGIGIAVGAFIFSLIASLIAQALNFEQEAREGLIYVSLIIGAIIGYRFAKKKLNKNNKTAVKSEVVDSINEYSKKSNKNIFIVAIGLVIFISGVIFFYKTNLNTDMAVTPSVESEKAREDSIAAALKARYVANGTAQTNNGNDKIGDVTVRNFTRSFYQSLELSEGENQKAYETGTVKFDKSIFLGFISNSSVFDLKRVENLTGNYHDQYFIQLVDIDSVSSLKNNFIVKTKVRYYISEVGEFINSEELELCVIDNELKLLRWFDLEGLEDKRDPNNHSGDGEIKKTDFYDIMGHSLSPVTNNP